MKLLKHINFLIYNEIIIYVILLNPENKTFLLNLSTKSVHINMVAVIYCFKVIRFT